MRAAILALLPLVALAGCTGGGTGTFTLDVTDKPDMIEDFAFLNVTVERIELTPKGGSAKSFSPSAPTFDLRTLTSGNTTTLFSGAIDVGNYTRLDLFFKDAKGTLAADGTVVDVKAPSGRIFLNTGFDVAEGQETIFLFDIDVQQDGSGDYAFTPNADGSGPRAKRES